MRRRSPRSLLWLLVPLLLLAGLGLHLSRARTPDASPDDRGDRPAGAARPAGEAAPAPETAAEGLRPPDLEEIPLAPTSEEAAPGIPRTPEIDRLAGLAGRQLGARLRLHFDVEELVHGGDLPAFERIEVSPETLETLISLLDAEDPRVRRDAAIRLSAAVLRPGDLPLLQAALERELLGARERDARHAAFAIAYALATQGERSGTARIETALVGGERSGDAHFRREAAIVLGMIADPESSETLRTVLRTDPDDGARGHAAQGLGRIGGDDNRNALADALARDAETEVRAWSAIGYGRSATTDGAQAAPLLTGAVDPEPLVRAASHFALSRAGGPGTSAMLVETFYADPEPYPRIGVLAGLTRRSDLGPAKREFLHGEGATWLADYTRATEDHTAVYFTVRTLRRIPGETAHAAIVSAVDSERPDWVRVEAVRNLARHDETAAYPELKARLSDEERPAVKRAIEAEIRRLERRAAKER